MALCELELDTLSSETLRTEDHRPPRFVLGCPPGLNPAEWDGRTEELKSEDAKWAQLKAEQKERRRRRHEDKNSQGES